MNILFFAAFCWGVKCQDEQSDSDFYEYDNDNSDMNMFDVFQFGETSSESGHSTQTSTIDYVSFPDVSEGLQEFSSKDSKVNINIKERKFCFDFDFELCNYLVYIFCRMPARQGRSI